MSIPYNLSEAAVIDRLEAENERLRRAIEQHHDDAMKAVWADIEDHDERLWAHLNQETDR